MGRFMTNAETIELFKKIDVLKEDKNLPEEKLEQSVNNIHNKIVEGLGFLVYGHARQYRKFPNYDDLVQEGYIGLLRATRKFNHNLFPNFFVYAERWIRHCIKRSASRFDVVYNPNRNRVVYADPTEVGQEEEMASTPEDIFFSKEQSIRVEEELNRLPKRDKEIVQRIFGLGEHNHNPQTLREIGPMFDLTHERIRQIKNKVVDKLRKNKNLGEFC